tara:strand:- start:237 stop:380 length:144 start_codon:yes stop_codon:yes gene_type:complete
VVGSRRSIRIFKLWDKVEKEKIQRILEVIRLTTVLRVLSKAKRQTHA